MKKAIFYVILSGMILSSAAESEFLEAKQAIFNSEYSASYDLNSDGNTNIFDLINFRRNQLETDETNKIYVSTSQELRNALKNADAGDEIILNSGVYEATDWGVQSSLFHSNADGSEENPIIIRSADPENKAILKGTDTSINIALYITGDYWIVKDIAACNTQKGIVFDNSNYSVIDSCEIYNIGSEGVHFRDNSSYCTIKNSVIHDTGVSFPEYGEGVYVGSSMSTSGYGYSCDYNTISGCEFYNVAAEHIDVKEFTTGTLIEYCTMDGTGIAGKNYADSFIDLQGNKTVVRYNKMYRNNNEIIVDAVQYHVLTDGWGFENEVYDNEMYLDDSEAYIMGGWHGSATVYGNVRVPDGNTYYGHITEK